MEGDYLLLIESMKSGSQLLKAWRASAKPVVSATTAIQLMDDLDVLNGAALFLYSSRGWHHVPSIGYADRG